MDPTTFELTQEQQFSLASMRMQAANASHGQLIELLVGTTRLAMVRQNIIQQLMRKAANTLPPMAMNEVANIRQNWPQE